VGRNGQGVGTSPFSEWVKVVSELHLPVDEKQQLDSFIDQVYEDLNEGGTASAGIVRHYLKLWVLSLFVKGSLQSGGLCLILGSGKFD
jgi:hypothetical protein